MKYLFFFMLCGYFFQTVQAQVKEGSVVFEKKVNLHKRLGPDQENMKNMIPEFAISKMQLDFAGQVSLFKAVEEQEDIRKTADADAGGERRIVFKVNGGDNEIYKDYATGRAIEQRELGPHKYLIEDSLNRLAWKLDETDTQTILGHVCKKALAKTSAGQNMIAWYAEDISSPSGPEIFGGLPGLILSLDIGDGEIVFTALSIQNTPETELVKAPAKGKKISRKEFNKMMEEQYGAEPGNGKPVIRIFRNGGGN